MNKKIYSILTVLFFLNIFLFSVILAEGNSSEVVFLNVGQGDSIFIEDNNYQILIDGGPSSAVIAELAKEMPFWDRTLDLIVLTHPDKDHISGLIDILKRYKVENILQTGVKGKGEEYQVWQELIKEEGANIITAFSGQRIIMGDSFFEVLNPSENLEDKEFKENNNTSIVLKLVWPNKSFLFTGDIDEKIEKELKNIDVDVLKVSHHGSKNSTSEEFLEKTSPKTAVIQVGKNNYGHPSEEVLARLEKFGIQVLRTDIKGNIKIKN